MHADRMTPQTLFSRNSLWQAWLDVEAAMALSQAEVGLIPKWAADEIARKARLEHFDMAMLEKSVAETMAPIVSLVRALSQVSGDAGRYVHWGGTTQNIMTTGRLLLVRQSHTGMLDNLSDAIERLGTLAEEHAETVMAGRTNRRQALPITFGFKVAGWIEELARQNDRFIAAESRAFALHFGGAIGAMHSFAGKGAQLNAAIAQRLGLAPVLVPDRVSLDGQAEYVTSLALFAMAAGRIGSELYRLMADETGEISENLGHAVIGSSTMPHKVNPKHVVGLISSSAQLRSKAAPALEAGMPSHEGDAVCNQLMSSTLESASALGWEVASRLSTTIASIEIHAERMSRNLQINRSVIATENLMMSLAEKIGRTVAHDLVHEAVMDFNSHGTSISDTLLRNSRISQMMTRDDLEASLDPSSYLGDSIVIARKAAELAAKTSTAMRSRAASGLHQTAR
jgi:3-carboxy-cis,cis-muconate cycloisomerase